MTRLARYRELLARIEPTDPSDFAGRPEIYVPPPNGLAQKLATALALQPTSSHLVVGPIGSGKTTMLRRAADALREQVRETGDHVEYIDVSAEHQLDVEPLAGVLIALTGIALSRLLATGSTTARIPAVVLARKELRQHAHGYREWVDFGDDREPDWEPPDEDDDPRYPVDVPGILKPQIRSTRFEHLEKPLRTLREVMGGQQCVLFFDSLDRLENSTRFADAVTHDLPVLAKAGIGVVVVGPYRFALSKNREVANLFDEIHAVQTANSESVDGRAFLAEIMRRRVTSTMLANDVLDAVAQASGGILRDMLSIATRAAREAYDRGRDAIDVVDVEGAVHAVGGAKAIGLDASSLELLRQVAAGQPFVLDEKRLSLVERGQVVQTQVGAWRVHPALQTFLNSMAKAA